MKKNYKISPYIYPLLNPKLKIEDYPEIQFICNYYKVELHSVMYNLRKKNIVTVRHICSHYLQTVKKLSQDKVANFLNKGNHSTALHSRNQVEDLRFSDKSFKEEHDKLLNILKTWKPTKT